MRLSKTSDRIQRRRCGGRLRQCELRSRPQPRPTQEQDLPDLGSPATAAVSLEEEYQVGLAWARQMRAQGLVLEDPEVSDYIQEIGHSLSSHAEEGQHQFNYFVVRDPVINAFAMPGGFIAINSGLFLDHAQRE